MSNDTAKTITTNIVPVQGTFEPLPPYDCINLIGPAGTPFFAPVNPNLDGVSITNSTINSSVIGGTAPAAGTFTNIATTTGQITSPPSGPTSIVNQAYVDAVAQGLSFKQPANYATVGNITLSGLGTQAGGDWPSALTAGNRILVKDQSNAAENGIYVAASSGWSRSSDANTWDELISAYLFVTSGSTLDGSAWVNINQPGGTLNVTPVNFVQFSNNALYTAGTGLTLAAFQFSITNTGVSAATYGSASTVPAIAVNAQGQITSATNTNIAIDAAAITSGTINTARISGDYSGITGVGTLTNLTVSNTISGSISGNAATATTAGSATTATTATNLAGGATGSIPYQSSAGTTTFLAAGTNGQVLTLAGGVPTYATPTTGTVTSVGGTGTVSGISLSGTVTSSGNLTLGGTLDLSAPPAIGGTTANTIRGTTVTATTGFVGTNFDAAGSGGGSLRNSGGSACLQWGGGGGVNVTIDGPINMNGANSAIQINPTGTGTVSIAPAGALTVNPTTASTMNNVAIGGTTPLAGTFTDLRVNNTISLAGNTGTAGFVLTSNGASPPTWQANSNGVTITDDTTTNATRYLTFSELTTGTETTLDVSSTKLQFNPSTGTLTATALSGTLAGSNVSGNISGNAANVTGTVAVANGGTGATSATAYAVQCGGTTSTGPHQSVSGLGTSGQVLTSNGAGALPTWQNSGGGFASGTVMLFAQTSAPTGWTKDTTNFNNSGLRVVTGTASSGGTVDFTTAFASQAVSGSISSTTATNQATTATNQAITPSGSVSITSVTGSASATTLTTPEIPSHNHVINRYGGGTTGAGALGTTGQPSDGTVNSQNTGGGGSHTHPFSFSSGSGSFTGNSVTALQNSHNHTQDAHNHSFTGTAINLAVKYVDVIRATKD